MQPPGERVCPYFRETADNSGEMFGAKEEILKVHLNLERFCNDILFVWYVNCIVHFAHLGVWYNLLGFDWLKVENPRATEAQRICICEEILNVLNVGPAQCSGVSLWHQCSVRYYYYMVKLARQHSTVAVLLPGSTLNLKEQCKVVSSQV